MKKILVFVCIVLFLATFVSAAHAAGRVVQNGDGTVTDKPTNLMWADHDNGTDINWYDAKIYCEGYGGGGKSGWRMPTLDELAQLHDSGAYGHVIKQSGPLVWSKDKIGSEPAYLNFRNGDRVGCPYLGNFNRRALPVRSVE